MKKKLGKLLARWARSLGAYGPDMHMRVETTTVRMAPLKVWRVIKYGQEIPSCYRSLEEWEEKTMRDVADDLMLKSRGHIKVYQEQLPNGDIAITAKLNLYVD